MKTVLKLALLLPSLALAQSAAVPMMGTAPAQPAPVIQAHLAEQTSSAKNTQKKPTALASVAERPKAEIVPPPSQLSKDLYAAVSRGNFPLAEMILQQGADINCRNCGERTALVLAIGNGNIEGVKWLVMHGVDVNAFSPSWRGDMTPLTAAAVTQRYAREIAQILLQAGANPSLEDINGDSPWIWWAGKEMTAEYKAPVLALMLQRGANVNQTNKLGYTGLMYAIRNASNCAQDTVRFLLERGADPSIKTLDGKTVGNIAYQQALRGDQRCNQVIALLNAPPPPVSDAAPAMAPMGEAQPAAPMTSSIPIGKWQGMFNATSPRNASVVTTATVSPSGDMTFASAAGLQGTGRLNVADSQVSGIFSAPSPIDANGRPRFVNPDGSTDVVFRLNGSISNGVIRGSYASAFESGTYVMCDSAAYDQTAACKPAQVSAGDLLKAVGGLIGSLKGLSNSTR